MVDFLQELNEMNGEFRTFMGSEMQMFRLDWPMPMLKTILKLFVIYYWQQEVNWHRCMERMLQSMITMFISWIFGIMLIPTMQLM